MTKITDIPAIRFKGFSDTWEQRKLSEIATMHARIGWQNLRTSEFLDSGDYMLITGTDFIDGAVNFDTCHYVERERYEQDKHIQIRNGSILITKDGTLGKVAYIQGLTMPATLNAGVFNVEIKDENEVDNRYLFQYLKAPFLMDYVDKKATGGTIKHLNQNILVDFPVVLPHKAEQEKIGEYFLAIDHLITLHQRKYDKLTNVKKSMLEKMFPQNGSNVPEIRFKGFTEAWEQRKLGEVAKYRNGKAHENCIDESGKYIVVNSKFVSTNGTVIKHSNMQNEPLAQNEIAFVLSDVPNGRAIARTFLVEENDKYTLNQRIAGITSSENTYPYFLHILMNRHPYFLAFDDGVKQTNLSVSDVLNFETYYPEYEEQKQIGEYFRNLDRLITLHQRELEKLKNLKKACLEKMFV
jgi:type I restriction enzyme S subunit